MSLIESGGAMLLFVLFFSVAVFFIFAPLMYFGKPEFSNKFLCFFESNPFVFGPIAQLVRASRRIGGRVPGSSNSSYLHI
ncbi:MAG: hypothetical protein RLZZ28_1849 [Bacteroidota bacterium]